MQKVSAIDRYAHLLGVETDRAVASLAGVSINAVSSYRRRRSIPAAHVATGAKATVIVEIVETHGPIRASRIAHRLGHAHGSTAYNCTIVYTGLLAKSGKIRRLERGLYVSLSWEVVEAHRRTPLP